VILPFISTSTGFPTAFTPASPGVSGATVDGTTNTLGGTFPFQNPSSGNIYISEMKINVSYGNSAICFFDLLWYNTGLSVTSATAQTVNSVTLPPRDANGTTNGVGVTALLYVNSAFSSSKTNINIIYTNSSGVSARSANLFSSSTILSQVSGTAIPFTLQAGDVGIQSIQSFTMGSAMTSGAVNLIMVREICYVGLLSQTSFTYDWAHLGFPILYNGTALSFYSQVISLVNTDVSGTMTLVNG